MIDYCSDSGLCPAYSTCTNLSPGYECSCMDGYVKRGVSDYFSILELYLNEFSRANASKSTPAPSTEEVATTMLLATPPSSAPSTTTSASARLDTLAMASNVPQLMLALSTTAMIMLPVFHTSRSPANKITTAFATVKLK